MFTFRLSVFTMCRYLERRRWNGEYWAKWCRGEESFWHKHGAINEQPTCNAKRIRGTKKPWRHTRPFRRHINDTIWLADWSLRRRYLWTLILSSCIWKTIYSVRKKYLTDVLNDWAIWNATCNARNIAFSFAISCHSLIKPPEMHFICTNVIDFVKKKIPKHWLCVCVS